MLPRVYFADLNVLDERFILQECCLGYNVIYCAYAPLAVSLFLLDLSVESRDSQKVARDHIVAVSSCPMSVLGYTS